MKASQTKESFTPVCLMLETQAEVDAIYALLNHSVICDAVELGDSFEALCPFKTDAMSEAFHVKISAILLK